MPDQFAPVVQRMFQMALEGEPASISARYLEAGENPDATGLYLMNTEGKYVANEPGEASVQLGKNNGESDSEQSDLSGQAGQSAVHNTLLQG